MLLHGFPKRAEDNALFSQFLFEGGVDRHAVEDGVHGYARQFFLFGQWDAQPLERFQQILIDLVEAFVPRLLARRRVIRDIPEIRLRILQMRPARVFFLRVGGQLLPMPPCPQAPCKQPLRLVFLGGNQTDDIFVKTFRYRIGLDVRFPAVFVLAGSDLVQKLCFRGGHGSAEKNRWARTAQEQENITYVCNLTRVRFVPVFTEC